MGDSDLNPTTPVSAHPSMTLADMIRAGDPDAISGFWDAHVEKVRSYCAAVCVPARQEEACTAALAEFLGRIRESTDPAVDLEDLLLSATRSAAAGRFNATAPEPPPGQSRPHRPDVAVCAAMPELLAAEANRELRFGAEAVRHHQASCPECAAAASRMEDAERSFRRTAGWTAAPAGAS